MNAASLARSEVPKTSAVERSLLEVAREQVSKGPAWLGAQRRRALDWLESNGLPTASDEAWRNASIAHLLDEPFSHRRLAASSAFAAQTTNEDDRGKARPLWLINGEAISDAPPIPGVRWLPLAEAAEIDARVRMQLGAHVRLEDGFVAANVAGCWDGWCVVVEPNVVVEEPIELRLVASTEVRGTLSLPRVLVIAGAGSKLKLLERHMSRSGETILSSSVTEIVVERGASVEHSRFVDHGSRTWSIAATAVSVEENAEYRCWSTTARGRFVRHDLGVRLAGRGAKALLDGLYYARQGGVVVEHTRVWHELAQGVTRECYRGVVEDQGRGVFDGIVYVGRGAMQTDARQENRNLLLGPGAIANTKPQLEIDADDVVCSHGATVGQLDEQQLFYLRSRGIDESDARAALTWAFAKEIVDRCPNEQLRNEVERNLNHSDGWEIGDSREVGS
jgi:Fe-S cluster assembly protein SufD